MSNPEEIEFILHASEDKKEITIVLKCSEPMTNESVVLELEYFINELSKADDAIKQPGTNLH